jgi:hypothetical protein
MKATKFELKKSKMKILSKATVLLVVFAGFLQNSIGQTRLYPTFNSVISGRSINILASGQFSRHEFGGGLRININKNTHNDDQNNIFKKRMYATKPLHYFGIEGFYHIHFLQKLQHIDLFAFYNIQLCYSTTGNRMFQYEVDPITNVCKHDTFFRHFGPFTWIEQNIGIGFSVDIWKNIFITQRLGVGTTFILGKDKPFDETKDYYLIKEPFVCEFGYLLSVGIGYRFEPKKK